MARALVPVTSDETTTELLVYMAFCKYSHDTSDPPTISATILPSMKTASSMHQTISDRVIIVAKTHIAYMEMIATANKGLCAPLMYEEWTMHDQ